ncbi:hypothetical protein GF373_06120, partial [bacterium]|nr:hypothetical protein [bacterium]
NQYGIIYQAELNKEEEVYLGEEILLTYTIYTPASRENRVHQIQQPTPDRSRFQNFWLETFEMGEDYKQTVKANNQVYYKFPLIRYILYPLTTGEQTISHSKIVCQVGRGRSSFFNFPIGRTVNVPVYSNPISLKVKPLPEQGKPGIFKGAVGQYKLNSEVDTTQVNVGDAVTLKVTLTGNGNLKNVPEPIMPDLSKFDSYDPVKNNKIDVSLDGVSGSIEYSYVLVPHDVKANRIEPVQFAYFDPKQEKYHTLKTNPIVLSVQPSQKRTVGVGNGMNRRIITMLGEDFRFNVVGLKALASVPLPIYRYITAWLLLLIPILALLAVLIVKQRETFLALNPAVARSRKAPRLAKKYLTEANNSLQKGETQTIYAQLSKALNDYISNRWSISSTGMTSGELRDTLAGLGVQPGTIQKVIGLFEQFDGYRFANTDIDAQQARQDIAQTETALTELMQQKTNK